MSAKAGSISKACEELRLSQPTVSSQIRKLEENIGEKLFSKKGRGLELTDAGRMVLSYAERIFGIGEQLQNELARRYKDVVNLLRVGVESAVPKTLAYRLIQPLLSTHTEMQLQYATGSVVDLVESLENYDCDMLISETPVSGDSTPRDIDTGTLSHVLGTTSIGLFARESSVEPLNMSKKWRLVMPSRSTCQYSMVTSWLRQHSQSYKIVAEIADTGLMYELASHEDLLVPAPIGIDAHRLSARGLTLAHTLVDYNIQYYLTVMKRYIDNPIVASVVENGRKILEESSNDGRDQLG